jgi:hypothetical protein
MRAINDAIECNAEARSFVGRIETLVQEADARLRARLIADEFNRIGFPAEAVGESVSVQTSGPGVRGTIGHSWPTDLDRLQGRSTTTNSVASAVHTCRRPSTADPALSAARLNVPP